MQSGSGWETSPAGVWRKSVPTGVAEVEAPARVCFGPWTDIPNQVRTQHDRPDEDLHGPYSPTPSRHGSESPGDVSPGDQRDGLAHGGRGEDAGAPDRAG